MSRAFVKGDDSDLSGEELPERPISPLPNYVTAEGLSQLRRRYDELQSQHVTLKAAGEDFDKPGHARIVHTSGPVTPPSRAADPSGRG